MLRKPGPVALEVREQVHGHFLAPRRHQGPMQFPQVRRDAIGKIGTDRVQELLAERLLRDGLGQLAAHLRLRQVPGGFDLGVLGPEGVLVGDVAVLDDLRNDALGSQDGEPRADRRSEVVQVEHETLDAELRHEAVQHARVAVEAVVEVVGRVAVPRAGIVRRDQAPPVREPRHEVAELVGGAGIAVRQEDHRRIWRACFTVEEFDIADTQPAMLYQCVHGCPWPA